MCIYRSFCIFIIFVSCILLSFILFFQLLNNMYMYIYKYFAEAWKFATTLLFSPLAPGSASMLVAIWMNVMFGSGSISFAILGVTAAFFSVPV